jgi:hypothetical protein
MSLDTIDEIYTTVWDDFTVKDSILYETEILLVMEKVDLFVE